MTKSPRLRARIASFGYAFRGIAALLRAEPNAAIHAAATLLVVALGFGFGIDGSEWRSITLAIAIVWSAEAFNTAIEALSDVVQPERDPRIELVKDVAAAGVLIAAFGAAAVGLLVFGPRILLWLAH